MNIDNLKSKFFCNLGRIAAGQIRGARLRRALSILAAASLAAASPAHATAYCSGKVTDMLIDKSGHVLVSPTFRGDWVAICNVNNTWGDVPPTTCTSWTATLTSAILTGKNIVFSYLDPVAVCSSVPSYYDAPSPYYVSIVR